MIGVRDYSEEKILESLFYKHSASLALLGTQKCKKEIEREGECWSANRAGLTARALQPSLSLQFTVCINNMMLCKWHGHGTVSGT